LLCINILISIRSDIDSNIFMYLNLRYSVKYGVYENSYGAGTFQVLAPFLHEEVISFFGQQ